MNIKIERIIDPVDSGSMPDRRIRVLGIDLGTTNSVVAEAVWDPGSPEEVAVTCIEVDQKTRAGRYTGALVPSVVALLDGEPFVGEGAKRLVAEASIHGLKRGRDYFHETKNEIGTGRFYNQDRDHYRCPVDIGGHMVQFLLDAAGSPEPDHVVVTVPASFQAAQRKDTIAAARKAGIELASGALVDEPIAAFVGYLASHAGDDPSAAAIEPGRLLVFDYGGGTCDIALLEVAGQTGAGIMSVSPISISRFHRLGGGDIDAAIAYGPLMNQLVAQNNLDERDLDYIDKKLFVEPTLRPVAESLKIGLSREAERRRSLEPDSAVFDVPLARVLPDRLEIRLRSGVSLTLDQPKLDDEAFGRILEPFFDPTDHSVESSEYRTQQSIFAPIHDALSRGHLKETDVDTVLLAGGSSNIPLCRERLANHFSAADILTFSRPDDRKRAVARGAALHALAHALSGGAGIVRPVCQDDIAIRTKDGLLPLIDRGVPLPFPGGGGKRGKDGLVVPSTSTTDDVNLLVEVVAGADRRLLFSQPWRIPAPVAEGDALRLEFCYDANQVLEIDLYSGEAKCECTIENPVSHVVNPASDEQRAERLARAISKGDGDVFATMSEYAKVLARLGRREQAYAVLQKLSDSNRRGRADILNRMGILRDDMYDHEGAARLYRNAAHADPAAGAPLYNLALLLRRQGRVADSIAMLEEGMSRRRQGSYLVFRAQLAKEQDDEEAERSYLREAFDVFAPVRGLSDFELGAYLRGANALGDGRRIDEAQEERQRRSLPSSAKTGVLPDLVSEK